MSDQGTEGLLSPWLREQRFRAARPYLRGNILDIGCGSGKFARFIDKDHYLGLEKDPASLHQAKVNFPQCQFLSELPIASNFFQFDTIVLLAVIEHVKNPVDFFRNLIMYLKDTPSARLIVTTPHPAVDWIHRLGASIKLFSNHASEEHEDLLDESKLKILGEESGVPMIHYSRFLFGTNQIAIYGKGSA